jgi:hypothetical protein
MEINPNHSTPPEEPIPTKPNKFDHLSSNPFVLQLALKGSSIILSFFKNKEIPNPNLTASTNGKTPPAPISESKTSKEGSEEKGTLSTPTAKDPTPHSSQPKKRGSRDGYSQPEMTPEEEKEFIKEKGTLSTPTAKDPTPHSSQPKKRGSRDGYSQPEMTPEEEKEFKEQIEDVLKGIFGEPVFSEEFIEPTEEEPVDNSYPTMHPSMIHKAEVDLINEVLYRVEKGFLALMINDHEIFSQDMLLGLLQQIPNPADRIELLSNSLLSSFSHMAVTPEGDENVIHVLELSSPPQKILSELPYLYLVKWRIFADGVAIEKESEYALVSPVKNNGKGELLPLYKYIEMIDFRQGQEEHDIQIEPSNRAFDPVHHRLIWGN